MVELVYYVEKSYNDLDSFQNGVDTIVDGCTTYGSTPSSNTPSKIVEAIKAIYNNRYTAGRTQGRNDVTNSPNTYGLYTSTQYNNKTAVSESGTVYSSLDYGNSQSHNITFSKAFSKIPTVIAYNSGGIYISVTASNITKTGCKITIKNSSSWQSNINGNWVAFA